MGIRHQTLFFVGPPTPAPCTAASTPTPPCTTDSTPTTVTSTLASPTSSSVRLMLSPHITVDGADVVSLAGPTPTPCTAASTPTPAPCTAASRPTQAPCTAPPPDGADKVTLAGPTLAPCTAASRPTQAPCTADSTPTTAVSAMTGKHEAIALRDPPDSLQLTHLRLSRTKCGYKS